MKIKLSKSLWEQTGIKAGWLKTANSSDFQAKIEEYIKTLRAKGRSVGFGEGEYDSYVVGALKSSILTFLNDVAKATQETGTPYISSVSQAFGAESLIKAISDLKNNQKTRRTKKMPPNA